MSGAAVITGYGVVSALGVDRHAFGAGLAASVSGVRPITAFDPSVSDTRVAAEVPVPLSFAALSTPALRDWYETVAARDRKVILALYAASEAWQAARCGDDEAVAALCLGIGLEQAFLEDFAPIFDGARIDWAKEQETPRRAPRFRAPLDLSAQALRRRFSLTGRTYLHVSACAAGTMALAHAAALIERGSAEVVLAGATDSMLNAFGVAGMSKLGAPSPRAAIDACRPFDRRRDGLVMGEGAAMFVVEAAARADKRGANALARISGYATSQDGYRVTAPRPDGSAAAAAMRQALRRARLLPSAIDYINAHGTGTPLNDVAEARAIRAVFGAHADAVAVSSIKGAVGHNMAAAGAVEAAACVWALDGGVVPGTVHHEERDPECDIRVLGPEAVALAPRRVLSNSFGFGGQNACIVLERA